MFRVFNNKQLHNLIYRVISTLTFQYNSSYMPHIDGLRAVAVVSVMLFHFGFEGFEGGFVGVDLFFVISGFLITRIILNEVTNTESFDFVNFYLHRARRIIPALYFTLMISFVFSIIMLSPQHLQRFGSSFIYAVFGVSNIFFWKESSYFDTESVYKPLLHTWSLGVEEQFYLFWPVITVYLLYKLPKIMPMLFLIIGGLSLYLSYIYLLNDKSSAIFYLTPFRVFEFIIGAVMVWLIQFKPKHNLTLELLMVLGLAGIGFSVATYCKDMIFPYYNALIPCLAAAFVIYSGNAKYSSKILNNRLFIGVGLISYSLYLIHWPVLIFYDYSEPGKLSLAENIVLFVIVFIAAILMYRFVEKPFRVSRGEYLNKKMKSLSRISAVVMVVILFFSYNASINDGWDFRLSEKNKILLQTNKLESHKMKISLLNSYVWGLEHKELLSNPHGKKILIIGDSHAGNIANAFSEVGFSKKNYVSWLQINANCDIIISQKKINIPEYSEKVCKIHHKRLSDLKNLENYNLIILASSWQGQGVLFISETIEALNKKGAKNENITIIASKYLTASGLDVLGRVTIFGFNKNIPVSPAAFSKRINYEFEGLQLDVNIIYPLKYFCVTDKECRVLDNNGYIINYDAGHLTPKGALFFGKKLVHELGYSL